MNISQAKERLKELDVEPDTIDWNSYSSDVDIKDWILNEYGISLNGANELLENNKGELEHAQIEENKPKDYNLEFINQLTKKALTIIILGKRGSGKTALGFYLLEQLKELTKRGLYTVGFPKKTTFENFEDIEEVPHNSICLIDEGSMKFDARRAMSSGNIKMSNILKIARHNDITTILITQNTADIEVRTLRLADVFLLKEPSLVQEYLERSFIKKLYQHINPIFTNKDTEHEPYYYVFSDIITGLFRFSLPKMWNEQVSKAHRIEKSIISDLFERFKNQLSQKKIVSKGDKK